jgi:hypothetical protein
MLLALAGILFIIWIFGFVVFHAAGALIHLLLLLAVISAIVHLASKKRSTPQG